jgi:hypothetical protein
MVIRIWEFKAVISQEYVMDHVVYLDVKAAELEKLLSGEKTMIIRGAAGRKMPYGRVLEGDNLYFLENDGSGQIKAQGSVISVINTEKLDPETSAKLVEDNQYKLKLSPAQSKRWAGKRYLVLIGVSSVQALEPFQINKSDYGNMDDWLPVGEIDRVKIK